jgi:hypothetical protein
MNPENELFSAYGGISDDGSHVNSNKLAYHYQAEVELDIPFQQGK